ncbi:hypothetical protein [Enterovirga sp.]|uniref:hypothetical protein n=1 Tax=Enterovirga sp. TaxID=2026350 RepID=UPI002639A17E|nr:hypothetical protein [Enterovirga sp.]MDB5591357.1 family phosphatase [Enterovirga sp.]
MKRLVVDLDGTITHEQAGVPYSEKQPNMAVIERLRVYKEQGYEIAVYTARNMRTYESAIGRINAHTIPVIVEWLKRHEVPFDELHVGKPWCGTDGFYVDDRAVRPSEFLTLSPDEIRDLIGATSAV